MTPADLVAAAPWIVFGAALAILYGQLRRSHRAASRPPEPPAQVSPDPPGRDGTGPAHERKGQPRNCGQHQTPPS